MFCCAIACCCGEKQSAFPVLHAAVFCLYHMDMPAWPQCSEDAISFSAGSVCLHSLAPFSTSFWGFGLDSRSYVALSSLSPHYLIVQLMIKYPVLFALYYFISFILFTFLFVCFYFYRCFLLSSFPWSTSVWWMEKVQLNLSTLPWLQCNILLPLQSFSCVSFCQDFQPDNCNRALPVH